MDKYVEVGYIKAAHGIKGEVFIKLFTADPDWLADYSTLLLHKNGTNKQFTITSMKKHKDGYIGRLKEVTNRNQSEELKGFTVMLPSEQLKSSEEDSEFYLGEILNFKIVDKNLGEVGVVQKFHFNGAQDLIVTQFEGRECEIPLVPEFIDNLDFEGETIYMNLPQGLIDHED